MKKIAYDSMKLDQLQIVEDSKCCLKVNSAISKEGVYRYEDGWALKPHMELLKAARTARYAKLTLHNHPDSKVIMSQKQLFGGVEKPFYDRNKLRAVLNFDKAVTPPELLQRVRDAVAQKTGLDVSIGFYYTHDPTPGFAPDVNTGASRKYDYIMRDILIDHVAVMFDGRLPGRCTFPNCGIGVDTMMRRIALDPFAGYKDFADCVAKNQDKNDPEAYCATIKRQVEDAEKRFTSRSLIGGKRMKTQKDYGHARSPEEVKAEFEECVRQRMEEGANFDPPMTREQAELLCQPATAPQDEPLPFEKLDQDQLSPWQKSIKEQMAKGKTLKEASEICKAKGITKGDQDAAFENCVDRKMEEGLSRGEAEENCRAEHPVAEEDEEPEPTPLERCIKNRMETTEGTEEEAKTWCEAELVGEHEAADSMIERGNRLLDWKRQADTVKRRKRLSEL